MKRSETVHNAKNTKKGPIFLDIMAYFSVFLVIVVFAWMLMNPRKTQADVRNSQRNTDVYTIMKAVVSYVKVSGRIPADIPFSKECASIGNEICKTDSINCQNYVDLSEVLGEDSKLKQMPVDAFRTDINNNGTGYYISYDGEGNILVCAPLAERNIEIIARQFMY